MRFIDPDTLDGLAGRRLEENDSFSFRCRPGLGCFNQCCRNLNLFLYPYDVVRLKNRLAISSDRFLERYVDVVLRPSSFFPEVVLRMSEDPDKSCPFLTATGCSIYSDRPDTCRKFPMEIGIAFDSETKKSGRFYWFRPPDFCLGPKENKTWTPRSWILDPEAALYDRMTLQWAELKGLFQSDPWGAEGPDCPKAKMAFMATYNIDRFRDFVLNSSFLKRYKIKSGVLAKIRAQDEALLKLGFEWVKFFLWGINSQNFRLK